MESDDARVLIVDDVTDSAAMLAGLLKVDGYQVRTAASGEEALDVVEQFKPLCVLMDIQMPGLGGHETCQLLRQRYGDEMVLVAVTGAGTSDDRISDSFAHFDHYLRKPVDLKSLRQLLPPVSS
ncbi:MAG: response regulator [Pseudomonadota bacterium]